MATEILINDGGAPARILPYTAAEALVAGDACTIDANGELQKADSANGSGQGFAYAGIALTNAADGDIASLITGVGVVLHINCADLAAGVALMMGTTAGQLLAATNAAGVPKCQAVVLEAAATAGAGLHKCQTL